MTKGKQSKQEKKGQNQNTKAENKTTKVENKNKKEIKNEKVNTKQDKNIQDESNTKDTNEFKRLLKIILIVTAIFALFYIVTIIVTQKSDEVKIEREKENKETEKAEIQYENIIIGTMLNKSGTYYVLIEDADDNRTDEYDSLVDTIKSNEDSSNIYKANLTDSFNKTYLGKEENYYVSDITDFKVKGTTLVKISDGKIDSVYDNYDAIKNKLTELA